MIKTIRGFMKRLNEDHVGADAAQSAYFILLSFIPFVLLVVTLVKYTPLTRDDVYSVLINMLPTEFQSYVGGIVNEIFYQSVAYMPITIITTLWSAGKGIAALTNGLNSIYHVTETRNYIINRLRGMAYTLIFVVAFLTSLVLLVFGTRIQNKLTEHLPHTGFQAFYQILDEYEPLLFAHGHVHINYGRDFKRISEYKNTKVVNAFEKYIIEI